MRHPSQGTARIVAQLLMKGAPMDPSELASKLGRGAEDSPRFSAERMLDHFLSKYPVISYHGRDVFLCTDKRDFGDERHIVSLHAGPVGPTPEHIYQYVLLTYCYRGPFPMTVDGRDVTLHEGDCLVADRHCPHAVKAIGPDAVAVNIVFNDAFFEERMLPDLDRVASAFGRALASRCADHTGWRVYPAGDALCRACIEGVLCEHLDLRVGSGDIIDDLCAALITHLLRTHEADIASIDEAGKDAGFVGLVHGYVSEHYRDGRLEALAGILGYDSSYLSGRIKGATGRTFKRLINEERMRRAMLLLQGSQRPVYEIAQEVGISNLTQFYKRFREYTGMTPREYRASLAARD